MRVNKIVRARVTSRPLLNAHFIMRFSVTVMQSRDWRVLRGHTCSENPMSSLECSFSPTLKGVLRSSQDTSSGSDTADSGLEAQVSQIRSLIRETRNPTQPRRKETNLGRVGMEARLEGGMEPASSARDQAFPLCASAGV